MDVDDSTIAFDFAVGSFRWRCDEYRRRIQAGGADLSCNEAIDAYRLMTPCFAPEPDQDLAKKHAGMNAIIGMCMEPAIGGFCFREPAIQSIIEGFEKEIDDGIETLYLRHDAEKEAREVSRWERHIAYCSLRFFVAHNPPAICHTSKSAPKLFLTLGPSIARKAGTMPARMPFATASSGSALMHLTVAVCRSLPGMKQTPFRTRWPAQLILPYAQSWRYGRKRRQSSGPIRGRAISSPPACPATSANSRRCRSFERREVCFFVTPAVRPCFSRHAPPSIDQN